MSRAIFSVGQGRGHFAELSNANAFTFNAQSWFIEVAGGVKIEDLLDPSVWGPQPRIVRGDAVTVISESDDFYAMLVCTRSSASYPSFKVMAICEREAPSVQPVSASGDGIEFRPSTGWTVIVGGAVVATAATRTEAEAALAEMGDAA